MGDIKKAVDFMVKIANDNTHGYDQAHRNGPDYDCSSLVATALNQAGFDVSIKSWTGNLESQLRKCGFVDCNKPWQAGDIHLNTQNHVCMSINSSQIAQASINENGGITGGKTGDQTGNEINIRNYYEYKYGWDVHLRYKENNDLFDVAKDVYNGKYGNGNTRKQKLTSAGYDYDEVQKIVNNICVAYDVIKGKYGNGNTRKQKLTAAGYDYDEVQKIVNKLL